MTEPKYVVSDAGPGFLTDTDGREIGPEWMALVAAALDRYPILAATRSIPEVGLALKAALDALLENEGNR